VTLSVAIALVALPAVARAEAGPQLSFETLLERFARLPGVEANFREEKRLAMLEAPLISTGRVAYCPPGQLLRRIEEPMAATVLVQQGRIQVEQGGRHRTVDLTNQPVMRHFVESFIHLLSGNRRALNELYRPQFALQGDTGSEQWELVLTPRRAELRQWLRMVILQGQGVTLSTMRVLEASGDETVTTFTNVNTSRTWTRQEQDRLFRRRRR
jgi:hypothetical protein